MIAIIDYGAGNLRSVRNALDFLGCRNTIAASAREILSADGVILPGVGAFGAAMDEIKRRGLGGVIRDAAAGGRPFLGICAGMQLLFDYSEESPGADGLSILPGGVKRFQTDGGLKVPHMGWNSIKADKKSRLLGGMKGEPYMYFVHSYYVQADDRADVSATAEYGITFDVAVEKGNIFGVQFHPEKSGGAGMSILRRFIELTAEGR